MSDSLYSQNWYRVAELKPRLRLHSRLHRHHYRDGLWYVLQNPVSGRFHRFSPTSYMIIGLLDGQRSIQAIWDVMVERLADEAPTQEDVIKLLTQLYNADILQSDIIPVIEDMQLRDSKIRRQKYLQQLRSPLAIRIPLFDPDRLLTALLPVTRFCFSKTAAVLWFLAMISGSVIAAQHWDGLTEDVVDRALAMENLLILWLVFPVVKAFHELGHGLAVKRWGGEVHEIGIMFLVFMPVPYVDASASSAFKEKHRRVIVSSAGMAVELFIAVIALLIWINAESGMVTAVMFNIMLVAGVSTLLFNGNPLLRFDGYYILSDIIEIPNLGQRSNQYIGYLLQRYLFRSEDARSPVMAHGEAGWFIFYSISSFIYRMFVMVAIVIMIGSKYFVVGVLLALWSLANMLLIPAYNILKSILVGSAFSAIRRRAVSITVTAISVFSAFILFVPVPASVRVEGVMWAPENTLVRPAVEGRIEKINIAPGSRVKKGEVLIQISDLKIEADVSIYRAQLSELNARYTQEIVNDRVKAQVTREEIAEINGLLHRAQERQSSLLVHSPRDGIFIIDQPDDYIGRYVRRNDVVAYVLAVDDATVRVAIDQDQADLVRSSTDAIDLRFSSAFDRVLRGRLRREVPAASDEIPSRTLTVEGGGLLAVVEDRDGIPRAVKNLFQFDVSLDTPVPVFRIGERAYVKFIRFPEPLAVQWRRGLRQLFLSQFDV